MMADCKTGVNQGEDDLNGRLARAAQYRQRGLMARAVDELSFIAAVLEQRGEMGRWVQVTEELLELCPNDVPRARLLAGVLLARGEARRAARWMHWSLIAAPGDVSCVVLLADALVQLEDTGGAIDLLVRAAATDGLDVELEDAIHTRLEMLTTTLQVPLPIDLVVDNQRDDLVVDNQPDDLEVPESGPVPWDPTVAFACAVPLHPSVASLVPEAALGRIPTAELESPATLYGQEVVVNGTAPLDDDVIEAWADVLGDVLGFPEADSLLLDRRVFDQPAEAGAKQGDPGRPRRITLVGVEHPAVEPPAAEPDPAEEERALIARELDRVRALLDVGELGEAGHLLRGLSRRAPAHMTVRRLLSELRCRLLSRSLNSQTVSAVG